MTPNKEAETSVVMREQQGQMLRLVAKGFYNELVRYGVSGSEVLTVAGHLLDNLNQKTGSSVLERSQDEYYNRLFKIGDIRNDWETARRLTLQQVSLQPFHECYTTLIASWLSVPAIRDSFYPPFPQEPRALADYLGSPSRRYFIVCVDEDPVGLIGAEQMDSHAKKLEMRKLVGQGRMHGKGIGKRATMLFLYYVFVVLKFRKVYVHSLDINIRNLNLNAKFGFELEGTLFDDALVQDVGRDVVRMGLTAATWLKLFS